VERRSANQQRDEARLAKEAVMVATKEALMATHEVAALVGEHSEVMYGLWARQTGSRIEEPGERLAKTV